MSNQQAINNSCKKFVTTFQSLLNWEKSFHSVIPDNEWIDIFNKFRMCTYEYIESTELFFSNMKTLISDPKASGKKKLVLTFDFPKKLKGIDKDVEDAYNTTISNTETNGKNSNTSGLIIEIIKRFL